MSRCFLLSTVKFYLVLLYTCCMHIKEYCMSMRILLIIVLGILVIDFLGFIAWVMSGQIPQDAFFVGFISKYIIGLFV